jgi:hypothetical protein
LSFSSIFFWPLLYCLSFFWPLYCLSFFDLRLLITLLVSSKFYYMQDMHDFALHWG